MACSNSLRSNDIGTAAGLLKQELRLLDCELIRIADEVAIPGGASLTLDRERFSRQVTAALRARPEIHLRTEELTEIPRNRKGDGIVRIAVDISRNARYWPFDRVWRRR